MAAESTLLSSIISRMNRWQAIYRGTEEQYLVYDLDEALRTLQREHQTPWTLKKSTLRVFADVLEYPEASDHLALAFIEGQEDGYEGKPKPYYTSIQEFYEDPNNRSQLAEIWDSGVAYLGVRNKNIAHSVRTIDSCELDSGYTISGDITAKDLDTTFFKTGNSSLRLTIVSSASTALLEKSFTAFTDTLYKRKYKFVRIYLSVVPTSINLRFGADSSNYLLKNVTTQFSGQAFKAGDWNLIALDANAPGSTVGTIDTSTSFDYYGIQLIGAASGFYYIDEVSFREWALMDYWYYSKFNVATVGNTTANQAYFMNTSQVYSTDSALVAPVEYADVAMYDAILSALADNENTKLFPILLRKREKAWDTLLQSFPSMEPTIITHSWRFPSQMGSVVKVSRD